MADREGGSAPAGLGTPRPREPERQRRSPRRTLLWALSALVAAGALLAVAAVIIDRKDEREGRQRAAHRRAVAAQVARLRRIQAPHRQMAPQLRPAAGASRSERLAARSALLDAARRSILLDARGRARRGELKGPILAVTCGPFTHDRRSPPDHEVLGRRVGRYDCLAVQRRSQAAVDLGHPFVAALDFERFTYVWCRNTPPQSERGEALAFVRLDRACLAARGKALGSGYASTPGDGSG